MHSIWHNIYRDNILFDIFATLDEAVSWTNQQTGY
jgi:hypothetical protein